MRGGCMSRIINDFENFESYYASLPSWKIMRRPDGEPVHFMKPEAGIEHGGSRYLPP